MELEQLKTEFNSLKTIDEKLQFWEIKLNQKYFNYYLQTPVNTLIDFEIKSTKNYEIEYVNKYNLDEYLKINKLVLSTNNELIEFQNPEWWKNPIDKKRQSLRLQTTEELIELLNIRLDDVTNKSEFLKSELSKIETKYSQYKSFNDYSNSFMYEKKNGFIKSYEDYIFNAKKPDYSSHIMPIFMLVGLHFGIELAKYKIHIEKLINPTKDKTNKKRETTTFQKLLGLYYLDVIPMFNNNDVSDIKKAEIISLILGLSYDDIRSRLRKIEPENYNDSDKEFLKELHSLLSKTQLTSQTNKIKKDIE